jgi:hypothetical protein
MRQTAVLANPQQESVPFRKMGGTRTVTDLTGRKVGRWLVLQQMPVTRAMGGRLVRRWHCRCECGTERAVLHTSLKAEVSLSCGCLQVERTSDAKRTHGMSKTRFYAVWLDMRKRCHDPKNKKHHLYGGRGITVCARWDESFEAFQEDMPGYGPGLQLDRINTDGNYEPGNCRWATNKENARNRRKTVFVNWAGEDLPLIELTERLGVDFVRVWRRYCTYGWTLERALAVADGRKERR